MHEKKFVSTAKDSSPYWAAIFAFPQSIIHEFSRTFYDVAKRMGNWRVDETRLLGAAARTEIMSSRKFPPVVGASAKPIERTGGYWKICVTGKSLDRAQTLRYEQSFTSMIDYSIRLKKMTGLNSIVRSFSCQNCALNRIFLRCYSSS